MSDADRERAVDVFKAAFAEGRLTKGEHGARVERAYGARTYAELAALSADLPAGPLGTLPSQGPVAPVAYHPAARQRANPLAVASLVCALIPGIPQIAAIILSVEAHRQIRRTGERGTALATAGLALSVLGLVLAMLVAFVFKTNHRKGHRDADKKRGDPEDAAGNPGRLASSCRRDR